MREATARGPSIDISEFERRLRGSEPKQQKPAGDPLAELARLLHGDDAEAPHDPYGRMFAPESGRAEPQPRSAPQPPAFTPGDLRGTLPPTVEAEPYYHQDEPAAAPTDWAQHEAHDYLDYGVDPDESAEGEPERPQGFFSTLRSRLKPWHAVAGLATLGAVSVGMVFGHRSGVVAPQEIATIRAPEGPAKVQPSAVADASAPKPGATILDRSQSAPVKQVIANHERPIDPAAAVRVVRLGDGPVDAPHEPAPAPYGGAEPKRVKTVSVRPDGTVIERDAPTPALARPAPAAPPAAARQPAPGAAKATQSPDGGAATPKSPVKPATTPRAAAPAQPKVEKPAAKPAAEQTASAEVPAHDPAPTAATGAFAVQFGAAGSEAEARKMIQDVSAKFGAQLGGRRPSFQFAKVGDKSVYRVRAAGMSREAAVGVCQKVKASGGNCFVAGN
ncbi:SPOR domain-containing protein [Methylosinus sp. Sm6]|uniref:SPOR domain-containing protein n=1 Tax=Methylosinus sp. Sm6 TaxID=2866948 RepID=UPI001C9A2041|nr:SPOR domain-containing protein [Methylosinus sp. Sm6]MBY6243348.1 SPOR domain-containing protein [Methylosinus sp. Sm6]